MARARERSALVAGPAAPGRVVVATRRRGIDEAGGGQHYYGDRQLIDIFRYFQAFNVVL